MKLIFAAPATAALVYRARSHKSLTPLGIVVAALTAIAHAIHPWNLPFVLLCAFFVAGTRVTKVKKNVKAGLTVNAQGNSGGEGPRTHVQVLANSATASVLTILHAYYLRQREASHTVRETGETDYSHCLSQPDGSALTADLFLVGIVAQYAAVCADTFSSELGILSRSDPRLITSLTLRRVSRGTNGGVTLWGLVAGLLGSFCITTTAVIFLPTCDGESWSNGQKLSFAAALTLWGALGSVVDSLMGGWLQRSVRDIRSGKIVEGDGGVRVLVSSGDKGNDMARGMTPSAGQEKTKMEEENKDPYNPKNKHRRSSFGDRKSTRVIESGLNVLDNNQVNFLMASVMSIGAMVLAGWYRGQSMSSMLGF